MRIVHFLLGLAIMTLGVSFMVKMQNLGVSSWDVLHIGLKNHFGLSIGNWSLIVGMLILISVYLIDKKFVTIASFVNVVLCGEMLDFYLLIEKFQIHPVFMQWVFFLSGVIIFGCGAGMYISAGFGGGPRDSFMLLIVEKKKWKVWKVRLCLELTALLMGILLGGPFNIGTVISIFIISPIVQFSLKFLKKKLEEFKQIKSAS